MEKRFARPKVLRDINTHYCAGCGHGILHNIVAACIDELGLQGRIIGVAPVGCAVIAYDYWDFDMCEAAHGRALAVATGIKRCRPKTTVFTYQGDGDLASIGLGETIHTANRGEKVTCIFVNNACYGMTGGQMAPTTLLNQRTTTTPLGRNCQKGEGWPIKISELIAHLKGVCFVARGTVSNPQETLKVKKYIKKAFTNQIENKGFSLVEVLSPCPTVWGKKPVESMQWIEQEMVKEFPLGMIKDI